MKERQSWPIWRTELRIRIEDLANQDQPENPVIALDMIYNRIDENQNGISCLNIHSLSFISKLFI